MTSENLVLPEHYQIEPELREQLGSRAGHQRCVVGGQELLLVIHDVPPVGDSERDALFFWRQYNGHWLQAEGAGLSQLRDVLERYTVIIDRYEEALESNISTKEVFGILRHAGPLARSTRHMVAALSSTLTQEPEDRLIRDFFDQAHELERAAELLQADARETITFLQAEASEIQAKSSEKLGKILFRLNLVTGFCLPLVALGSLFGMNVNLPGFVDHLFWVILFFSLCVGGALLWYVAKDELKRR